MKNRILSNSDGILSVDYIFALVLAMGFMIILFSLSMTLTMVDIVQYMTFSSARVYAVAYTSEQESIELAKNKFIDLYTHPAVSPMFEKSKWFVVGEPKIGDRSDRYPPNSGSENKHTFYGVSVGFNAKMLDIKIPFYGSTNTRDDGQGFVSEVHSFLGREPSLGDCINFTSKRLQWLYEAYNHPRLRNSLNEYKLIADNGC